MNTWKTGVCDTNGINLHYMRSGRGKPPLVLLHGLTANGACWSVFARILEKEYDIIMPDARGHGKSSVPDFGYRYEDHAKDVIGLINTLKLPPVVLLGHSMGGMTAAVVASTKPKLLRAAILADPPFLSSKVQREVRDSDVTDHHRQILGKTKNELMVDLQRRHPNRSLEIISLIAGARHQTSMAAFDVLTPPNPDYKQLVSEINVSGLLVFGENGVVSNAVAQKLHQLNPRLQIKQIPEVGHGLHYDQPERFASVIRSYLFSIETPMIF